MNKNTLLALVGLLLLGVLGFFLVPGMLGGDQASAESGGMEPAVGAAGSSDEARAQPVEGETHRSSVAVSSAPSAGVNDQSQSAGVIRGRVVDKFAQPVAKASVAFEANSFRPGPGQVPGSGQARKPVLTAADGRFELPLAGLGKAGDKLTVTLVVTHERHAPAFFDKVFEAVKGDLAAGDLAVTKGGVVLGAVTDLDGNAVPGSTVQARPAGMNRLAWSRNRDELLPKIAVDPRGGYVIPSLMPGDYRIEATAPRKTIAVSEPITVRDDAQEQLEPLRLGPGHAITGVVLGSAEAPVAGADVMLSGGRGNQQTRTDPKGEFTIDHLSSDPVTVRVGAKGYLAYSQPNVQPSAGAPLLIRLIDGLKIAGIVRDAQTGEPVTKYAARARRIAGLEGGQSKGPASTDYQRLLEELARAGDQAANVKARFEMEARSVPRMSKSPHGDMVLDSWVRGGAAGNEGFAGQQEDAPAAHPDGTFVLPGLDEGVWVVDIHSPDHQRVRSEQVTLRSGTVAPSLSIVLPRGFDICGRTISTADGQPLAGAIVELVAVAPGQTGAEAQKSPGMQTRVRGLSGQPGLQGAPPQGSRLTSSVSDKEGKFAIRHLAPGRYLLTARADGHTPKTSPEIELTADRFDEVLSLGALATLTGRVLDVPTGKEGMATVVAFAAMGNQRTVKAKEDGSYELTDLLPGGYSVRAFLGDTNTFLKLEIATMGRGGADKQKPDVTLAEGEQKSLDLKLTRHPIGTVAGLVQKNGLPAPGLQVHLRRLDGPAGKDSGMSYGFRMGGPGGGGPGQFMGGGVPPATTDQRGEFTMPDVPEGRYQLKVQKAIAGMGGGSFVMNWGSPEPDLYRQEIVVRAEITTRVDAMFQTGAVQGRVVAADSTPGELSGSLMLYGGTTSVPADLNEFQKTNFVVSGQVRGGAFKTQEMPSGEELLVVQLPGRDPIQQSVVVPIGDTLAVEVKAGKKPATQKK